LKFDWKKLFPEGDHIDKEAFRKLEVIPRRWGALPTLDLYILREFLIKWTILLLVFSMTFLMSDVFNDLSDMLVKQASVQQIVTYFMLKMPGNIRFVLPISMLLGCMWTMAAFGKNLEITAMRASGVSLFRCAGPIFAVGLLVTGANIYFNEQLVPYTDRAAADLIDVIKHGKITQVYNQVLAYRSPDGQRSWCFPGFSLQGANNHVTLKKYAPDGKTLRWELTANEVDYDKNSGWTFRDVMFTQYSEDGLLPNSPENRKIFQLSTKEAPERPSDIGNTIKDEEELPSWVIYDILRRNKKMSERMRDIYTTMFFYRLAFPWACFLAVFLGVPLATKNERSGIMMSIIVAVAMILLYIICAQGFMILGKRGVLNSAFAGLAPTIVFVLYGAYKVIYDKN